MDDRSFDREVRAGIQQAKVDETGATIVALEVLGISIFIGYEYESVGVRIFCGLAAIFAFRVISMSVTLSTILAPLMGLIWGAGAYYVASTTQADKYTMLGVSVLATIIGAGMHQLCFQYFRDLRRSRG